MESIAVSAVLEEGDEVENLPDGCEVCSLRLTEGKDSNQQLTMVPIRKSESQTRSSLCSCGNER